MFANAMSRIFHLEYVSAGLFQLEFQLEFLLGFIDMFVDGLGNSVRLPDLHWSFLSGIPTRIPARISGSGV